MELIIEESPQAPLPHKQFANTSLCCGWYKVPRASLTAEQLATHTKRLTFVPKCTSMVGCVEDAEPIEAFSLSARDLCVPRGYGFEHFGSPACGLVKGAAREHLQFEGELRVQQQQPAAVQAALASFDRCNGAVILLPCGFGKTTTALYIASVIKGKTIILVHKSVLLTQWEERIRQFIPSARVGVLRGDRAEAGDDVDIVIAMLQTVYKRRDNYTGGELHDYKLAIVDEAHRMPAHTFHKAASAVQARFTLGLTATPDRRDGLTDLLYASMGPIAFQLVRPPQDHLMVCNKRLPCGPDVYERQLYGKQQTVNFSRLVTDLAKDTLRTDTIVDDLANLMLSDRYVILLSDRTALLKTVREKLLTRQVPNLENDPHGGVQVIIGATKQSARENALQARCVLSTFSLAAEGLDQARLDTLVLATPKGDVVQAVGRIMREHPGKCPPLVLNYCESVSSGLLMGLYKKRQRTLGQHGFTEIPNLSAAAEWGKQDVSEEELSEDGAVLK